MTAMRSTRPAGREAKRRVKKSETVRPTRLASMQRDEAIWRGVACASRYRVGPPRKAVPEAQPKAHRSAVPASCRSPRPHLFGEPAKAIFLEPPRTIRCARPSPGSRPSPMTTIVIIVLRPAGKGAPHSMHRGHKHASCPSRHDHWASSSIAAPAIKAGRPRPIGKGTRRARQQAGGQPPTARRESAAREYLCAIYPGSDALATAKNEH